MKKSELDTIDIVSLILGVIFATCAPFVTLIYLQKHFSVLIIVLVINLIALPVVAVLAILALKKDRADKDETE